MLPTAILLVILGGAAVLLFASVFARFSQLENRIDSLERKQGELVTLISDAIIGHDQKESLELKLRSLLSER